jgi:hypothetical protein
MRPEFKNDKFFVKLFIWTLFLNKLYRNYI